MYNHLNTAFDGLTTPVIDPHGGKGVQAYAISDQDVWQGIFRVQRNFYP